MHTQFPTDFNWGVATTAVQIEGGLDAGGRGPSMWPDFARQHSSKIWHGDTPAGSAASYHHLERDLNALAELGVTSYNFTPSWTRILPSGAGQVNESGVDYYNRLIDGLLERGIQPDLSLYDWDIPRSYNEAGGWTQRELKDRFGDYVDVLIKRFSDRVEHWMTFNEISTQATNGYHSGSHAPGRTSLQQALQAYHHLMLAHGESIQRIRQAVPDASITLVDNFMQYYPATVSNADRSAQDRKIALETYFLMDAVFHGKLNATVHEWATERKGCNFDHIRPGDFEQIKQPIDQYGMNYFTAFNIADDPQAPGEEVVVSPAPGPQSPFGWTIDPVGMRMALNTVRDRYTGQTPIFIGECGIGQVDYIGPDGRVRDPERIDYLYLHLEQLLYAMEEDKIPVKGFYVWSLMDNYEWEDGYKKRMGLYYTQYDRPAEYVAKDSARWFAELCRTGVLRKPSV